MKAGQDLSDPFGTSFSSGSEQTMTRPLHLPRSLYFHPEVGLDAIGSKLSFGTNQVSRHLSGPYEVSPRSFMSPRLSIVPSHSAGAESAKDAQQHEGASDFPVLLGQLPSFSSASCSDLYDISREKLPLFLPSQTPNRDMSPRDTFSSQAPSLQKERTSPPEARPHHPRIVSHNDHPHVGPLCTSALQNLDANNLEEAISLHDGRSLHATRFTTPKPTKSPWPIEIASDNRPRTFASSRYQRSGSFGKGDRRGFGCTTKDTKSSKALHARSDSGLGETPVPKRTKRIATPVRAMAQGVPFYAPTADLILTASPLTPLDFGDHEKSNHVEGTQTHSKPSATTNDDRVIPRQGCSLTTLSPSAPHPDLGQNPPVSGACRPSVIVYKVAKGPNFAKSKDVIRISYGEGCQKRTRMKHSGRRSKRGDAAMHLDMKSVRSYFCTTQRCHGTT
ncbi:hypothetical protein EI94DRAFT_737423 [Lactarius quietus]|nr:hypothetical protein EI94DRAFT_737423 [Lactarius quietus]